MRDSVHVRKYYHLVRQQPQARPGPTAGSCEYARAIKHPSGFRSYTRSAGLHSNAASSPISTNIRAPAQPSAVRRLGDALARPRQPAPGIFRQQQ